ncbi:nicotinamide-nucleotide amidohydrolase family protein [Spirochaeta thermophila]|uniref:CinA-like protein n=1 Tax=Winmispira thermophila (strain ATCC 49972 / DSM 6192 / RI 19.B1) TaxID=665571 RepID=E0RQE9_WINT6|nr:nicotinamide-nucleotide amidohydrolase family protein [Spirochaeta thermophila]ADN02925.1 CinA-like protein [Spirochaeta thermophila DSM 6192]
MHASIIVFGTELLSGRVRDSHVQYLSRELRLLGVEVREALVLPDDPVLGREELSRMIERGGVVVVCGGLGPTSDDHGRELLASCAGVPLVFREDVWQALVERYPHLSEVPSNRRQAYVPEGFEALPNPAGTAPGLWGRVGKTWVAALPGPPVELARVFGDEVAPRIRAISGRGSDNGERMYTTYLIPESALEDALAPWEGRLTWATQAQPGRVFLVLSGGDEETIRACVASLEERFLPVLVFEGEKDLFVLLKEALARRGLTVGFAESCTGGRIASSLTKVPGASEVFWGGVVVYSNEAKERLLGVRPETLRTFGAVSRQTVEEMVRGVFEHMPVDVAAAVSGIAGPSGGSPEKPVGTVCVGVGRRDGRSRTFRALLRGDRERIQHKSALLAGLLTYILVEEEDWLDRRELADYIENKLT